jgi:hypothetical protein
VLLLLLLLQVHGIRVALIRAAKRLGYDHDYGVVKQVGNMGGGGKGVRGEGWGFGGKGWGYS